MNETEKSHGSWWHTFPGMLTAITGTISALAGLFVVLHQVGLLGGAEKPPSETSSPAVSRPTAAANPNAAAEPASPATKTPVSGGAGRYSLSFPQGSEVSRQDVTYRILGTKVAGESTATLILTFSVRATSMGDGTVLNDDLFRLQVDGVPRAPVRGSSEYVPARSAKEGDFVFEIPKATQSLVLTIGAGENAANLPVSLAKSG